ncbi:hypothetical protein Tcan_09597 [Toxocara canis]|uniref:Uncharacterized protein n=1 Tax=Toxocara canis TaxID=6265 RepID=A0A0B2VDV7_TOXCA|nr:hypothetical protein Tcan_09597 [Toxocara canis]
MVGKVDENQKQGPEMDPDTSISFDLSLAASQEFCRRRRRVLENMEGDELLRELLHKTLAYWLNARTHLRDLDRAWAHTRCVIVAILRNITIFKTLISIKHLISSMHTE